LAIHLLFESFNFYFLEMLSQFFNADFSGEPMLPAVLRIRIRMFLDLPDPDPLVQGPAPDPDPSIIKQK
jgi:hypothetical protein